MAHIEGIAHGPTAQHEKFKKKINNMEIPIEGKYRRGYAKPLISETKHYDIRIKKDALPELTKFLQNFNFNMKGTTGQHIGRFWDKILRIICKFTPLNYVERVAQQDGEKQKIGGWFYFKILGYIDDPKNPDKKDKELL